MIHGHWLRELGLDGSYEKLDIAPANFAAFMRELPASGWAGGNVTIPHKEAAFALASRRDEAAEAIGAANTLWKEDRVIACTNTDTVGFASNLDDLVPGWDGAASAVVLGAGGSARAIVHALKTRGIRDIRIVNRTIARARELADRFGAGISAHGQDALTEVLADCRLLVNTTSLGLKGNDEKAADPDLLPDDAIVTDIVYVPLKTPLLRAAEARGLKTADGLGMLLHQAVPGFERWFGVRPTVSAELRSLVVADIEGHT